MKFRKNLVLAAAAVTPLMFAGVGRATAEDKPVEKKAPAVIDDLQAAFQGESNANARYTAFAKKADEEGYAQVARLFRAAAKAEEVHAASHATVIRAMNAEPKAEIAKPDVKTTKENLTAALAGESYERDTMYPEFLGRARTDKNIAAIKTFNLARAAEVEHATFYKAALDDLEGWKKATLTFYVCTVCGHTTTAAPTAKCPTCFSPKEAMVVVD